MKVPESKVLQVIAAVLGMTRYFACSIPSSMIQPISMYGEPVHFPLMTSSSCSVANEIGSSEYAGSMGQQLVKQHCSSECKAVTEKEVAAIVYPKQAFEDAFHLIYTTQQNTALYTDDLNNTQYFNTLTYFHTSSTLCVTTLAYTLKHPTLSTSL